MLRSFTFSVSEVGNCTLKIATIYNRISVWLIGSMQFPAGLRNQFRISRLFSEQTKNDSNMLKKCKKAYKIWLSYEMSERKRNHTSIALFLFCGLKFIHAYKFEESCVFENYNLSSIICNNCCWRSLDTVGGFDDNQKTKTTSTSK